jgi:four helix bundle protein
MTAAEYNQLFQKRTKAFALDIIKLIEALPKSTSAFVIGKQLIRSATSVAANYRASCIARSDKERFAKICIVIEETDESLFWLEMLLESRMIEAPLLDPHLREAQELVKVFMSYRTSLKTHLTKNET